MQITFNDSDNSLEIKDNLKSQYTILYILMILNVINSLIRLIGIELNDYGTIEYVWGILGVISLFAFLIFLFKRSTANKIELSKIKRVNEKTVLGRKIFSLELNNGKKRNLGSFTNEFELAKARELFTKTGLDKFKRKNNN